MGQHLLLLLLLAPGWRKLRHPVPALSSPAENRAYRIRVPVVVVVVGVEEGIASHGRTLTPNIRTNVGLR